jgi:hypothetical protein
LRGRFSEVSGKVLSSVPGFGRFLALEGSWLWKVPGFGRFLALEGSGKVLLLKILSSH